MTQFFNFLFNSNLFISTCAAANFTYFSQLLNKVNPDFKDILFVFLATFFSYHLMRIIPYQKKDITSISIKEFYDRYLIYIYWILLFISFVLTYLFFQFQTWHQCLIAISFLIVCLYEMPFLKSRGLRYFPYLKPLIITTVWMNACYFFAAKEMSKSLFSDYYFIAFIFIFLLSVPLDLIDSKQDKKNGLTTIANQFKVKPVLIISFLFLAMFNLLIMNDYFYLVAFFIYLLGLIYCIPNNKKSMAILCFDGLIIFQAIYLFYFR